MIARVVVGVFVGGRSARMGGHPKGLLPAPDTGEALVTRALRVATELGAEPVLVGEMSPYTAIAGDVVTVDDDPAGIGPLGGLCGLLAYAGERTTLALACDMPHVRVDDLRALLLAHPGAPCVAGRLDATAPWEPFFARYDPVVVLPEARAMAARGERSLQRLLERVGVRAADVDARAIIDWDTPDDLTRSRTP